MAQMNCNVTLGTYGTRVNDLGVGILRLEAAVLAGEHLVCMYSEYLPRDYMWAMTRPRTAADAVELFRGYHRPGESRTIHQRWISYYSTMWYRSWHVLLVDDVETTLEIPKRTPGFIFSDWRRSLGDPDAVRTHELRYENGFMLQDTHGVCQWIDVGSGQLTSVPKPVEAEYPPITYCSKENLIGDKRFDNERGLTFTILNDAILVYEPLRGAGEHLVHPDNVVCLDRYGNVRWRFQEGGEPISEFVCVTGIGVRSGQLLLRREFKDPLVVYVKTGKIIS